MTAHDHHPTAHPLSARLLTVEEAIARVPRGRSDAAVLVPIYPTPDGLGVVFTQRALTLRKHAGEISFPGGRRDPGEDLVETAVREAEEEIGLGRERVRVIGALPPIGTFVTRFRVYPFVGLIDPPSDWTLSAREVERVLELDVAALRAGRQFKPLWQHRVPVPTPSFQVGPELIWGATGRMVHSLLPRLP